MMPGEAQCQLRRFSRTILRTILRTLSIARGHHAPLMRAPALPAQGIRVQQRILRDIIAVHRWLDSTYCAK